MYLEHISMVYSVRGDISRTAALPGKASVLRLLALPLQRPAGPGRLPRQRLAVIAVDLALLLRRQLRRLHLTGVAPNQCSSAPPCCPWGTKGWENTPLSLFTHSDRLKQAMLWDVVGFIHQQSKSPLSMRNHWYHISAISRKHSAGLLFSSLQGCSVCC